MYVFLLRCFGNQEYDKHPKAVEETQGSLIRKIFFYYLKLKIKIFDLRHLSLILVFDWLVVF